MRGFVQSRRRRRCAAFARTGVVGCRASRSATRRVRTNAGLCCRPAGEQVLLSSNRALAPPEFRRGGSGLSDPAPLLGNAVTAGGLGLEGHDGIFARKPNGPLRYPDPVTNSLIHATTRSPIASHRRHNHRPGRPTRAASLLCPQEYHLYKTQRLLPKPGWGQCNAFHATHAVDRLDAGGFAVTDGTHYTETFPRELRDAATAEWC